MRRTAVALALACCASGCHSASSTAPQLRVFPAATIPADQIVATVDGQAIGMADVATQARAAGVTTRVALQQLITAQTLVAEAARRGLVQAPEVVDAAEQEEVRALLSATFARDVTIQDIPLPAVRHAYVQNRTSLDHDVQIDVWHILIPANATTSAPDRARAKAAAEDLARRARGVADATAFCALAATVVAPAPAKYEKVVTAEKGWTVPEFSQGAFRTLHHPGDTSPVIETEYGYHVMFLNGFHPALHVSLAEADPHIREQLFPEFRRQRFLAWCDELAGKHTIIINSERLTSPDGE